MAHKPFSAYSHDVETGELISNLGQFDSASKAMLAIGDRLFDGIDGSKECLHLIDEANDSTTIWVAGPKPSLCIPRV